MVYTMEIRYKETNLHISIPEMKFRQVHSYKTSRWGHVCSLGAKWRRPIHDVKIFILYLLDYYTRGVSFWIEYSMRLCVLSWAPCCSTPVAILLSEANKPPIGLRRSLLGVGRDRWPRFAWFRDWPGGEGLLGTEGGVWQAWPC